MSLFVSVDFFLLCASSAGDETSAKVGTDSNEDDGKSAVDEDDDADENEDYANEFESGKTCFVCLVCRIFRNFQEFFEN